MWIDSVERAIVVIFGLDSSASGLTDRDGRAVLVVDTSSINVVGEGYLKLVVKADGFADYNLTLKDHKKQPLSLSFFVATNKF